MCVHVHVLARADIYGARLCACVWTGAKKVVGLELCGDAVKDAKRNAAANSVSNCEFEVGRAEDTIPQVNPD
jgi:tRNA/tmRNA/rRNA uracil-C5-methylase (TrmA/RlmC/RlmD family)